MNSLLTWLWDVFGWLLIFEKCWFDTKGYFLLVWCWRSAVFWQPHWDASCTVYPVCWVHHLAVTCTASTKSAGPFRLLAWVKRVKGTCQVYLTVVVIKITGRPASLAGKLRLQDHRASVDKSWCCFDVSRLRFRKLISKAVHRGKSQKNVLSESSDC